MIDRRTDGLIAPDHFEMHALRAEVSPVARGQERERGEG